MMSYDGFPLQDVHDWPNGAFRQQEGLLRVNRTEKYGVKGLVLPLLDFHCRSDKSRKLLSLEGAIAVLVYLYAHQLFWRIRKRSCPNFVSDKSINLFD